MSEPMASQAFAVSADTTAKELERARERMRRMLAIKVMDWMREAVVENVNASAAASVLRERAARAHVSSAAPNYCVVDFAAHLQAKALAPGAVDRMIARSLELGAHLDSKGVAALDNEADAAVSRMAAEILGATDFLARWYPDV